VRKSPDFFCFEAGKSGGVRIFEWIIIIVFKGKAIIMMYKEGEREFEHRQALYSDL
jgi:hypothetical protein